ncbi:MAG: endonuclease V [Promethearchaeota archaeon]
MTTTGREGTVPDENDDSDHVLVRGCWTLEEAEALQQEWAGKVGLAGAMVVADDFKTVAGVDVSYPPVENPSWGVACAVLWDVQTGREVARVSAGGEVDFPYIAGFLGFREAPLMVGAVKKLQKSARAEGEANSVDLVLVDGHGKAHPREFGSAVHVGAVLGIPTVGVAKSPFVGTSEWRTMERVKGNSTGFFRTSSGELIGRAVCLGDGFKPVFVSAGYGTTLDAAVEVVTRCAWGHRLPEPLFLADRCSREAVHFNRDVDNV